MLLTFQINQVLSSPKVTERARHSTMRLERIRASRVVNSECSKGLDADTKVPTRRLIGIPVTSIGRERQLAHAHMVARPTTGIA